MNATRVLNCAGRRLGMFVFAMSLLPLQASEIVVAITGRVRSGEDPGRIFGGTVAGKPFTLVFTYDDSKGQPLGGRCRNDGSGIITAGSSPGTAVLTIDGVPLEFGKGPNARSSAYRSISSFCGPSELRFEVSEGPENTPNAVKVSLEPRSGSFSQNPNWRAPLESTDIGWGRNLSAFVVHRGNGMARGVFSFTGITVVKR